MRTKHPLYIAATLLLFAAFGLSACGANPRAQAQQESQNSDILPTPPPMPILPTPLPTETPVPAPANQAPAVAGAQPVLRADFSGGDLSNWQVIDATGPVSAPSVWRIANGHLEQVSDGEDAPGDYPTALVTGDPTWKDYLVSTVAYASGNEEMGLVFRAGDKGFYTFRLQPAAANGGAV
jgi:hypothetical protein